MLSHGDEMGRTQGGNNNVYCQDNEIAWMDWSLLDKQKSSELYTFTKRVIAIRHNHPVFRRQRFFSGGPLGADVRDRDVAWLVPSGRLMTQDDWDHDFGKALMVYLNGNAITERDQSGQEIKDDSFIMMFNAHDEEIEFRLPTKDLGAKWQLMVDTAYPGGYPKEDTLHDAEGTILVQPRSTLVLKQTEPPVFESSHSGSESESGEQEQ